MGNERGETLTPTTAGTATSPLSTEYSGHRAQMPTQELKGASDALKGIDRGGKPVFTLARAEDPAVAEMKEIQAGVDALKRLGSHPNPYAQNIQIYNPNINSPDRTTIINGGQTGETVRPITPVVDQAREQLKKELPPEKHYSIDGSKGHQEAMRIAQKAQQQAAKYGKPLVVCITKPDDNNEEALKNLTTVENNEWGNAVFLRMEAGNIQQIAHMLHVPVHELRRNESGLHFSVLNAHGHLVKDVRPQSISVNDLTQYIREASTNNQQPNNNHPRPVT